MFLTCLVAALVAVIHRLFRGLGTSDAGAGSSLLAGVALDEATASLKDSEREESPPYLAMLDRWGTSRQNVATHSFSLYPAEFIGQTHLNWRSCQHNAVEKRTILLLVTHIYTFTLGIGIPSGSLQNHVTGPQVSNTQGSFWWQQWSCSLGNR